jgi:hypothetical protein
VHSNATPDRRAPPHCGFSIGKDGALRRLRSGHRRLAQANDLREIIVDAGRAYDQIDAGRLLARADDDFDQTVANPEVCPGCALVFVLLDERLLIGHDDLRCRLDAAL